MDNSVDGSNGLPSVTGEITINGNGATIERSSDGGTPDFRIVHIDGAGNLMLNNLSVTGGVATGVPPANRGGGILNSGGTVTLTDSTVSGNSASELGGGIAVFGTLTLTNSTVSDNSANDGR